MKSRKSPKPVTTTSIVITNSGSGAIGLGSGATVGKGGVVVYGKMLREAASTVSPRARARFTREGLRMIRGSDHG